MIAIGVLLSAVLLAGWDLYTAAVAASCFGVYLWWDTPPPPLVLTVAPASEEGFLSDEEITDCIFADIQLDEEACKEWLAVDFSELVRLHHTVGQCIRNDFRMWDERNPHSICSGFAYGLIVTDHEKFPDVRSQRVVEAVWRRLQDWHGPLPESVRQQYRDDLGLDEVCVNGHTETLQ